MIWQVSPSVAGRGERNVLVVRGANPVNFLWTHPLERVKPARARWWRSRPRAATGSSCAFAVRPLTLPRYGGDPGAQLLLASVALERYLEAKHPGLIIRNEGRTRINLRPGYQITWQTKIDGHTAFGRDIMVVDDVNAARVGATLEMVERALTARPEGQRARAHQPAEAVAALVPARDRAAVTVGNGARAPAA